jgi:Asp-tRNA(Asn)/Glu-tRNA(Gln) amidotransferase A subunit family amidase
MEKVAEPRLRIGIDTGGTFTDIVSVDARSGDMRVTKVASTPANPAIGLRRGVEAILAATGGTIEDSARSRARHNGRPPTRCCKARSTRSALLLTPVAPVKPFPVEMSFPTEINGRKIESYIDWIAPTFLVTLVSLPAGSVPAGLTNDRLPVGLQIVAPRFEEPRILRIAKLVQQMNPIGWPPPE